MRKKAAPVEVSMEEVLTVFKDERGRVRTGELISEEEFDDKYYQDVPESENAVEYQEVEEVEAPEEAPEFVEAPEAPVEVIEPEPEEPQKNENTDLKSSILNSINKTKPTEIVDVLENEVEIKDDELVIEPEVKEVKITEEEVVEVKPNVHQGVLEEEVSIIPEKEFESKLRVKEVNVFEPTTRREDKPNSTVGKLLTIFESPKMGEKIKVNKVIKPEISIKDVSTYQLENFDRLVEKEEERKKKLEKMKEEQEKANQKQNGVTIVKPFIERKRKLKVQTASEVQLKEVKAKAEEQKEKEQPLDKDYVVNFFQKYRRLPKK